MERLYFRKNNNKMKSVFTVRLQKLWGFIEKEHLIICKPFTTWQRLASYHCICQITATPWHRDLGDLIGPTKLITSHSAVASRLAGSHPICFKILHEMYGFSDSSKKKILFLLQSALEILLHGENIAFLPFKRFTLQISSKEENYIISLQTWAFIHQSLIKKLSQILI